MQKLKISHFDSAKVELLISALMIIPKLWAEGHIYGFKSVSKNIVLYLKFYEFIVNNFILLELIFIRNRSLCSQFGVIKFQKQFLAKNESFGYFSNTYKYVFYSTIQKFRSHVMLFAVYDHSVHHCFWNRANSKIISTFVPHKIILIFANLAKVFIF